jgi:hypothetical protein
MKEMENTKDLEKNSRKDENEHDSDGFVLSMQDKHNDNSEMSD